MEKEKAVELLKSCNTSAEWNVAADKIKDANGGDYPDWWFPEVVQSGLMDDVLGEGASTLKFVSGIDLDKFFGFQK